MLSFASLPALLEAANRAFSNGTQGTCCAPGTGLKQRPRLEYRVLGGGDRLKCPRNPPGTAQEDSVKAPRRQKQRGSEEGRSCPNTVSKGVSQGPSMQQKPNRDSKVLPAK